MNSNIKKNQEQILFTMEMLSGVKRHKTLKRESYEDVEKAIYTYVPTVLAGVQQKDSYLMNDPH